MAGIDVITHQEPAWREYSDFIISADISSQFGVATREQLWAKEVGTHAFEICCIPFFVYNLALGDVVTTSPVGGSDYELQEVIRPSGRFVFRAWLESAGIDRKWIVAQLEKLSTTLEWSSVNLVAIDAVDLDAATLVADYLESRQRAGQLVFESGRSA